MAVAAASTAPALQTRKLWATNGVWEPYPVYGQRYCPQTSNLSKAEWLAERREVREAAKISKCSDLYLHAL